MNSLNNENVDYKEQWVSFQQLNPPFYMRNVYCKL